MTKIRTYYRRTLAYIRWFGYWGVELVILLAIAIAVTVTIWPGVTEQWLRYVGTAYLLVGTGYGVWALYQLRTLFGMSSTRERFRTWLAARPQDRVIQISGVTMATSVGHATVFGWADMGAENDQMKALIANVTQLRKSLDESNVEHRGAVQKLRTDFEAAKSTSEQGVAQVSKLLKSAHTDGLGWAFAALVCLIIGTVMTAIAPDIGQPAVQEYVPFYR